jgi:hypothetical protein
MVETVTRWHEVMGFDFKFGFHLGQGIKPRPFARPYNSMPLRYRAAPKGAVWARLAPALEHARCGIWRRAYRPRALSLRVE